MSFSVVLLSLKSGRCPGWFFFPICLLSIKIFHIMFVDVDVWRRPPSVTYCHLTTSALFARFTPHHLTRLKSSTVKWLPHPLIIFLKMVFVTDYNNAFLVLSVVVSFTRINRNKYKEHRPLIIFSWLNLWLHLSWLHFWIIWGNRLCLTSSPSAQTAIQQIVRVSCFYAKLRWLRSPCYLYRIYTVFCIINTNSTLCISVLYHWFLFPGLYQPPRTSLFFNPTLFTPGKAITNRHFYLSPTYTLSIMFSAAGLISSFGIPFLR